ncbi:bleomycin resistance protein [Alicyclobacillus dauci]|uniref:bleomycin resistance protein n=1 Tax=Alicyclobacillus dauci TaxID=1475485 RepID=UPI002DD44AFD|nr:VOC family protein [Alicyclobacillus dauci]
MIIRSLLVDLLSEYSSLLSCCSLAWREKSLRTRCFRLIFNRLIPELSVSNFERSLSFYTDVLLFAIEYQRPEHLFAFLNFQGSQLMIEQQNGYWETGTLEYPCGRGINFSIQVDSLDDVVESLNRNNHPIRIGPKVNAYRKGDRILRHRELLVLDPDGYLLRFTQHFGLDEAE